MASSLKITDMTNFFRAHFAEMKPDSSFFDDGYDDRLSICCPQCSMTGPDAVGKQTAVILWNHHH